MPGSVASSSVFHALGIAGRVYRLTDGRGQPHPVLDEVFESLDAAHEAAAEWLQQHLPHGPVAEPAGGDLQAQLCLHFGIEVSTPSGDWRTLRHAGLPGWAPALP